MSRLQTRLDRGDTALAFDDGAGYLQSVLAELKIPVSSQTLVFSKTSLQQRRISPQTPRAIYFGDDVYVGYCVGGEVLEISAVDARLGTVFYTLDQTRAAGTPTFVHRMDSCLVCHRTNRTEGVPGHLARSLYVDREGHPVVSSGSRFVNHTTPLAERWGGWYVTGTHGSQRHLGNLTVADDFRGPPADNTSGMNITSLSRHVDTSPYLTPHSDIVALMVLEHQVLVHNCLASASLAAREALAEVEEHAGMGPPKSGKSRALNSPRMQVAVERLLEALLMVGESTLAGRIEGTSPFAAEYEAAGRRDSQGRSLRDLDLSRRLFKHPCSPLIYSEAFTELPAEIQEPLLRRLREVLLGMDQSDKFRQLSAADRHSIWEILRETRRTSWRWD
ncbi:MAG: hypothetical protein AB7O38_02950 [Pirellulaceae bacterium]